MRKIARKIGGILFIVTALAALAFWGWKILRGFQGNIVPAWGNFGDVYVFAGIGFLGFLLWSWGAKHTVVWKKE
jgi:hypothetical protein